MRKLALSLTATAPAFAVLTVAAEAQNQAPGAARLHAQVENATPFREAACRGWGPHCPPGRVERCNRWRCWCGPC